MMIMRVLLWEYDYFHMIMKVHGEVWIYENMIMHDSILAVPSSEVNFDLGWFISGNLRYRNIYIVLLFLKV